MVDVSTGMGGGGRGGIYELTVNCKKKMGYSTELHNNCGSLVSLRLFQYAEKECLWLTYP